VKSFHVFLACAVLLSPSLCASADETEEQQFKRLWDQGINQLSNEEVEEAILTFKAQVDLAPEHPGPRYNLACAYAKAGKNDDAVRWLERAVELGWMSAEQTGEDSDLASLRSDPRFEHLLQRMEENQNRWLQNSQKAHRTLDPSKATSFGTLSELLDHFDAEERSLAADAFRYSHECNAERRWNLLDHKVAALRRFMAAQPEPGVREAAAIAELVALASYKEMDLGTYWDADGRVVVAAAERFLEQFPNSRYVPDVLFTRAMATWLSRPSPPQAGEQPGTSFPEEYASDLDSLLADLTSRYPTSLVAATALVKRLELAEREYAGNVTPLQKAVYAKLLDQYGDSAEIMRGAWRTARRTMRHMEGFSGFHGTDLHGHTWDDTALRGSVVLIDFWATWCGPCIRELPTLQRAYQLFSHQGFKIVGVSLDTGDEAALQKKLTRLGITWPQIFDGAGWESPLARRFNVYSIPCTVLLDRDGMVAGVDYRGEELIQRIAELVDMQ
jgi:thiol-disulfide isomerase/thioredoxin